MRRHLPLVVAVLAVLSVLPRTTPTGAGPEAPAPWRCGTELSPGEVAAFQAREAQFGPLVIPHNAPAAPYCVPIAAHIVRTSSGSGGLTMARLNQGIADCNTAYANTGIKFLLLSVDYIDDDDYYYNIDTSAEIDALIQENVVADAINVYFTPNLSNEDGGLCGRGSFTTSSPQGVAMNNGCTGLSSNPSTFPHEIGHYLDLFHTHETAFGAELVDGSNCGTAGDKLCDTPADPTLDEGNNIDSNCNYYGSETDGNGDSYNPDTHQIMSYAPKTCRDVFSPQSEAKVVATLLNLRANHLNRGCAPTADAGDDIVAECTSPTTTPVMLDGSGSSDPEGAALTYAWSASGVTFDDATLQKPTGNFPYGTTSVQLVVFDGTYRDTAYVDVTIQDTTDPTINCPVDVTVECNSHMGVAKGDALLAGFFLGVSATDACDASPSITNNAPDYFALGETTVTFTATDDHNNSAQCTAKVTVIDTTPPEIDVVLDRDALWPPNHKLVTVCIDGITVTDICDPNPTWVLWDVESDEPDNSKGDGNTTDDIQGDAVGTADHCIELRSERLGGGDGRKYTVYYQAMDGSGNTAYDTVCVEVPHDQSAAALASSGFTADGAQFSGADSYVVVIPSSATLDASALDVSRIYVGNTAGAVRAAQSRTVDVNNDGLTDLAVFYSTEATIGVGPVVNFDLNGGDSAIRRERGDGPLGLHFVGPDGTGYLVSDIFALGTPVALPGVGPGITPLLGPGDDEPRPVAARETVLNSVHPNPFNPQTTVSYTLAGDARVRIAIYDVRGSLVRLLVDEAQSAGEHHEVWNGVDDAGRPATSGIYFVRMIAGSHVETRKIVMLK